MIIPVLHVSNTMLSGDRKTEWPGPRCELLLDKFYADSFSFVPDITIAAMKRFTISHNYVRVVYDRDYNAAMTRFCRLRGVCVDPVIHSDRRHCEITVSRNDDDSPALDLLKLVMDNHDLSDTLRLCVDELVQKRKINDLVVVVRGKRMMALLPNEDEPRKLCWSLVV